MAISKSKPEEVDLQCITLRHWQDLPCARIMALSFANRVDFNIFERTELVTAVSELATNTVMYAKHGSVTFDIVKEGKKRGVSAIFEDCGPGIKDIEKAMEDGYSTSGGQGKGLPGAKKLVDRFSIESNPDGTTVRIVKWK